MKIFLAYCLIGVVITFITDLLISTLLSTGDLKEGEVFELTFTDFILLVLLWPVYLALVLFGDFDREGSDNEPDSFVH